MTIKEKRERFTALAKEPHLETGRDYESHHGQLELDFSPKGRKRAQAYPSGRKAERLKYAKR